LGLFVKTNEFIFQHYILTKFLYSFGWLNSTYVI
jgi:hypothetical protein